MRFCRAKRAAVLFLMAFTLGCDLLFPSGDEADDDCETVCQIEADCGLRDLQTCQQNHCASGGESLTETDACILDTTECAEAALCTCSTSCAKSASCLESADSSCESRCETLMEQIPEETFAENRCTLESECEELALCGQVGP